MREFDHLGPMLFDLFAEFGLAGSVLKQETKSGRIVGWRCGRRQRWLR